MRIRVAVIEDDVLYRDDLVTLINKSRECVCVAECSNPHDATRQVILVKPDVALVDIDLSHKITGMNLIAPLKQSLPDLKILILTVFTNVEQIVLAFQLGADGYLLKTSSRPNIIHAIQEVARFGSIAPAPEIWKQIQSVFRGRNSSSEILSRLTPKQREVLQLWAQQFSDKEIAHRLSISINTLKTHRTAIFKELQVHRRGDAVGKLLDATDSLFAVRRVDRGGL